MDLANVFALLGLLAVGIGGVTGAWLNLSSKIDRCYDRMDENKEQYYNSFVEKDSYGEGLKHLKEMFDQKHNGLENIVKERLDNLASKIDEQSTQIRLLSTIINNKKMGE